MLVQKGRALEPTKDVSEHFELVTAFSSDAVIKLTKQADSGKAGVGDFYLRIRARDKIGGRLYIIMSGIGVSADLDEMQEIAMAAIESIITEDHMHVYLEILPERGSTPMARKKLDWGPSAPSPDEIVMTDDGTGTYTAAPKRRGGTDIVQAALAGVMATMNTTLDISNRANVALRLEQRIQAKKVMEMALKERDLIATIEMLKAESWEKIVEMALKEGKEPLMALLTVVDSKFQADRAQTVSKEDRESVQFDKGWQEHITKSRVDVCAMLDSIIAMTKDGTLADDQKQAALMLEFTRAFGPGAAQRIVTLQNLNK